MRYIPPWWNMRNIPPVPCIGTPTHYGICNYTRIEPSAVSNKVYAITVHDSHCVHMLTTTLQVVWASLLAQNAPYVRLLDLDLAVSYHGAERSAPSVYCVPRVDPVCGKDLDSFVLQLVAERAIAVSSFQSVRHCTHSLPQHDLGGVLSHCLPIIDNPDITFQCQRMIRE